MTDASTTAGPILSSRDDAGWRRLLAWLGVDMRPGEGGIALVLFLYFFLLITAQYVSRSVRESEWVTKLSADNLPFGFILVAICSYPILVLFSRLVDRMPRHILIASTSVVSAASLGAFWWLFQFPWLWVPVVFYVWISIIYVMTVSQFWSYANHTLDPRQAKRLFGFIGAGGLLGGFAGGQLARLAQLISTRGLLLISAAVMLGLALLIYLSERFHPTDESRIAGAAGLAKLEAARGGFEAILASRHLKLISAVMVCTVVVANIVNLQFAWAVQEATSGLDERTTTFGLVLSIMSISAFFFQILFTSRIHRVFGIGVAMRILPVTMAIGTVALLFAPMSLLLVVAVLLFVGEKGLRYSLDQATRELLFLPVPSKARFKAKAYIDVFIQRFAKGIGAGVALIGTWVLGLTIVQVGWFTLGIIALWLGVTVAMRRQFVRSFRDGLRARAVDTSIPIDLSDATSIEVMVQSLGSPDPRQVLQGLGMLTYHGKGKLVPPLLLYHESPEVRRETLEVLVKAGRTDAMPLIERLLGDEDRDVRTAEMRVLAALRSENLLEMMVSRLSDPDLRVRAAAISSVANRGTEQEIKEATAALAQLAGDAGPDARAAAADALADIDEPESQEYIVQLLYDDDLSVVRGAISAVGARVERGGRNPLFPPILISLMRDRRLKHEAREALVAYGETVIPALFHFMNDPQEQMWVRRAVPKTVACISGTAAAEALLDNLGSSDQFLRRKVAESLASLRRTDPDVTFDEDRVAAEIEQEARRYFLNLTDLVSLAGTDALAFEAPMILWPGGKPLLLHRLIADRARDNLEIIFGMLSLVHSPRDIRASYQGLTGDDSALRTHALEYLDNTLSGNIHRSVFSVINDESLSAKMRTAQGTLGLSVQPREDVLRRLVLASVTEEEGAHWLGAAAIHAICIDNIEDLYPQIEDAARRTDSSFAKETASWASERLGLAL